MKKSIFKRIAAFASAAVLCVGATVALAGCTTKYPEITITYTFNGKDYKVEYTLSRYDAPKTVQHFIELADAGYYDGLCIHDYDSNYIRGGGYTIEDGELEEKDYFTAVKALEESGTKFTQLVWINADRIRTDSPIYVQSNEPIPTYTVYGEFSTNGNSPKNGNEYVHSYGALVMDYTDKGKDTTRVRTERNDKGADNDGNPFDEDKYYKHNSATSLFYTYLGSGSSDSDNNYAVFGKVKDEEQLKAFIEAIDAYKSEHGEDDTDYSFTEDVTVRYTNYDPVTEVRASTISATYHTPIEAPIVIKSVKVDKY